MIDSSSEPEDQELIAELVSDVLKAKMESAQAERTLVHRLRLGVFEMEIVPDGKDITEFFNQMVDKLHEKYGDEVLKARILHDEGKKPADRMHQWK